MPCQPSILADRRVSPDRDLYRVRRPAPGRSAPVARARFARSAEQLPTTVVGRHRPSRSPWSAPGGIAPTAACRGSCMAVGQAIVRGRRPDCGTTSSPSARSPSRRSRTSSTSAATRSSPSALPADPSPPGRRRPRRPARRDDPDDGRRGPVAGVPDAPLRRATPSSIPFARDQLAYPHRRPDPPRRRHGPPDHARRRGPPRSPCCGPASAPVRRPTSSTPLQRSKGHYVAGSPLDLLYLGAYVLLRRFCPRSVDASPDRSSPGPGHLARPVRLTLPGRRHAHRARAPGHRPDADPTACVVAVGHRAALPARPGRGSSACRRPARPRRRPARSLEAQLSFRAFHDPLTGLTNRRRSWRADAHSPSRADATRLGGRALPGPRRLQDDQRHARAWCRRRGRWSRSANRCRSALRGSDLAARLGGDEFGILLRTPRRSRAIEVAERLLATLNEPLLIADVAVEPGSIGIAMDSPVDAGPSTTSRRRGHRDVPRQGAGQGHGVCRRRPAGRHGQRCSSRRACSAPAGSDR